jgi:S-adenosylmethionine:tRNA ribosyltransferase-isomerase
MLTADFDYELPPERIAQRPAEPRDSARMMLLDRRTGLIEDSVFNRLPQYLRPQDLLVLNETRVISARLQARKIPTGGWVEILLLERRQPGIWEALVGGRGMDAGKRLQVVGGPEAKVLEELGGSRRLVEFSMPIDDLLPRIGAVPVPPYIRSPLEHPDEYQTVYAHQSGSVAAPTAGLHFTVELLRIIEGMGVQLAYVTLHIGLDTFAPVTEDDPRRHAIHSEWCQLSPASAAAINRAHDAGGRIIAVGTTSVRTLETAALAAPPSRLVAPIEQATTLYILPGFQFRATDALITNFHLPRSTLLMLVSAYAGREWVLAAYQRAIASGYRFYSFGDAMFIHSGPAMLAKTEKWTLTNFKSGHRSFPREG